MQRNGYLKLSILGTERHRVDSVGSLLIPLQMMYLVVSIAVLFAFLDGIWGYPQRNDHSSLKTNVDCSDGAYPTPMSYHIHITYMLTNSDQINSTATLRAEAESHFAPLLGDDKVCRGTTSDSSGRYG